MAFRDETVRLDSKKNQLSPAETAVVPFQVG